MFCAFSVLLLFFQSCTGKKDEYRDHPVHPEILDMVLFKKGSFWVYQNQLTMAFDTITIANGGGYHFGEKTPSTSVYIDRSFKYTATAERAASRLLLTFWSIQEFTQWGKMHQYVSTAYYQGSEKIYVSDCAVGEEYNAGTPSSMIQVYKVENGYQLPNRYSYGKTVYMKTINSQAHGNADYYSVYHSGIGLVEFMEKGELYKLIDYKVEKVDY